MTADIIFHRNIASGFHTLKAGCIFLMQNYRKQRPLLPAQLRTEQQRAVMEAYSKYLTIANTLIFFMNEGS